MSTTQNAQIGRKNSTTVYTRPATDAQITYFSRHGGKKNLYHSARQIVRVVWLIIATVGLRAVLLSIAPGLPNFETISWVVALVVVAALHNLLEEVTKTFWFDRFDDKDGDGNTRDAADSSPILPLIICVGLIAADFLGARTYLYSSIAPAQTADRAALTDEKKSALAQERTDYEKRAAEIEQRFEAKKRAAAAAAAAEVRQWNSKQIFSDNDRAWVARGIAAANNRRDAAFARLDAARGEELSAARSDFETAKKKIETRADLAEARADDHDSREMSRVLNEQQAAHQFSWLISLFLAVLYMAFMYAEVRISARSGIFPVRNYTALDAHGGFFEKLWKWVVVDVWQRFSHNFMVQAHERLAVRNLADFDGHLIEDLPALPAPIAAAPTVNPVSAEVSMLQNRLSENWKAFTEFGEDETYWQIFDERRELLDTHGFCSVLRPDGGVRFYPERVSFQEMMTRHPAPDIKALAPAPNSPTRRQPSNQEASSATVATVGAVAQFPQENPKQAQHDDWLNWLFTKIQKEPSNFSNPEAKPQTVAARVGRDLDAIIRGLEGGNQPALAIRIKTADFCRNKLFPAMEAAGQEYSQKRRLFEVLS